MAVVVRVEEQFLAFVKGALETIQGRLTDVPSSYVMTYKKYTRQGSRVLALAFNEAWIIADIPLDLHDPRLLAMAVAERHLLEAEYDDSDANRAVFCRSATLILMALLLLRHVLTMGDSDSDDVPYVDLVSTYVVVDEKKEKEVPAPEVPRATTTTEETSGTEKEMAVEEEKKEPNAEECDEGEDENGDQKEVL
ncbi:hypothetical protein POM88_032195 [Heracleum sosnowskyi]|uniref:Uncharacterized protein n=1 Tax=Heracleum sosnowskyi TaxID=360622 RepID=A0AAD8I0T9_9APIA|nr:hypothetical protein POM88_032195 [Heracleum sosnowskyi]